MFEFPSALSEKNLFHYARKLGLDVDLFDRDFNNEHMLLERQQFNSDYLTINQHKNNVKKILLSLAILLGSFSMVRPAQAGMGQNNIGPSVIFGSGETSIGVSARFAISDNFSIRPNIYFPASKTIFGAALTYDLQAPDTDRKLIPYLGLGVRFNSGDSNNNVTTPYFTAGADYDLDSNIVLKGNVSVPFSSDGATTTVAIGVGLRL